MPMQKHIVRRFDSFDDMRLAHLRDCQRLSTDEINDIAWQMVIEYRQMYDIQPHEPRLQRHVTSVRRS